MSISQGGRFDDFASWDLMLRRLKLDRRRPVDFGFHRRLKVPEGQPNTNVDSDYILDVALGDLGSDDTLLDIGCGYGSAAIWAASRGAIATGISPSLRQLEVARDCAESTGVTDKCSFLEGSFETLDRIAGSYSTILTLESLVHATNLSEALRRMRCLLAAGGRIVVVDDVFVERPPWEKSTLDLIRSGWETQEFLTLDRLENAADDAGLAIRHRTDLSSIVRLTSPYKLQLLSPSLKYLGRAGSNRVARLARFYYAQASLQSAMHSGCLRYLILDLGPETYV